MTPWDYAMLRSNVSDEYRWTTQQLEMGIYFQLGLFSTTPRYCENHNINYIFLDS